MGSTPNSTDFLLALKPAPMSKSGAEKNGRMALLSSNESGQRFRDVLNERSQQTREKRDNKPQDVDNKEKSSVGKGGASDGHGDAKRAEDKPRDEPIESKDSNASAERTEETRQNARASEEGLTSASGNESEVEESQGNTSISETTDSKAPENVDLMAEEDGNILPQELQHLPEVLTLEDFVEDYEGVDLETLNAIQALTPEQLEKLESLVEGGLPLEDAVKQIVQALNDNNWAALQSSDELNTSDQASAATASTLDGAGMTDDAVVETSSAVKAGDGAAQQAMAAQLNQQSKSGPMNVNGQGAQVNVGGLTEDAVLSDKPVEGALPAGVSSANNAVQTQTLVNETMRAPEPVMAAPSLSEALRNAANRDLQAADLSIKTSAQEGRSVTSDSNTTLTMAIKPLAADGKWGQTLQTLQQMSGSQDPNAPSFKLPVMVGSREWGQAMADKMMWLASQKVQSAEVRLDPPELGPLQVKIAVNQENASISFVSHSATVRDLLDQNAFRLREMFEQGGFNLVDVDVSGRESGEQAGDGDEGGNGLLGTSSGSAIEEESTNDAPSIELLNLVDYYV